MLCILFLVQICSLFPHNCSKMTRLVPPSQELYTKNLMAYCPPEHIPSNRSLNLCVNKSHRRNHFSTSNKLYDCITLKRYTKTSMF